jgi:hypothetical protein
LNLEGVTNLNVSVPRPPNYTPRWDSFTEHVRRDRSSIQNECPQYARDAEKARTAA